MKVTISPALKGRVGRREVPRCVCGGDVGVCFSKMYPRLRNGPMSEDPFVDIGTQVRGYLLFLY